MCYNCGTITHSHSQCFEKTLVAYHFDLKAKYPAYCYPRGYQGQEGEEQTEFGNVTNEKEAWDYNLTIEPKFYTEQTR